MEQRTDVVIVGAGPAGIFTALEMLRGGSQKNIVIVEKGQSIEKRSCPKHKTQKCVNCKPYCHITTGFSGAGAFSDGKLSLSSEVGGDLPRLVGDTLVQETIDYTDKIYLEFGADEHIEGLENTEEVKEIRKRAIRAGLKLVDCPIRHLGTEKAQSLYLAIEKYLQKNGVEILFGYECTDLILQGAECHGVVISNGKEERTVMAAHTVIATGRRGADWLEKICAEHSIAHQPGTVDIGVRVEVRNEVMETVNRVLYESKLVGYPRPFKNKVRTFCQNPGGFVSQENYDNDLAVVNGHSYKELKSNNTNVAILCSHNFSEPFNQPISYAQKVGELTNMLGAGHIMVQRFGDILDGKRTWQKELEQSNVRPTLPDAVAGDITAAMPYRAMTNIIGFIQAVDEVVPGFASTETLLYSPELKFYSNRVKMDTDFNTNVKGLHCLGDSSGWTRGLMMASVMGVLMGRKLI
ncbi:MAG: FAD-dependent oxidoreductase [Ruminococcaceae bacterium]|nr:FAD-dependent oxidoreductase [Oscillospiraceae bacterium]